MLNSFGDCGPGPRAAGSAFFGEILDLAAPGPKQTAIHFRLTRLDLFDAAWPVGSAMALGHSM